MQHCKKWESTKSMNRFEGTLDAVHVESIKTVTSTELERESHLRRRFLSWWKGIWANSLRYLYKDKTVGYSELVKATREIESELEENKSDAVK